MDAALQLFHVGDYAKALAAFQLQQQQPLAAAYAVRCLLALPGRHAEAETLAKSLQPSHPLYHFLALLAGYRGALASGASTLAVAAAMRQFIAAQPALAGAVTAGDVAGSSSPSRSSSPTAAHGPLDVQLDVQLALVVAAWLVEDAQALEQAMRLVAVAADRDAESAALLHHLLLRMNRPDLAEHQLAVLRRLAEDQPVALLAEAAGYLQRGAGAYQDAFYIYQELLETYGSTTQLLNGQAACELLMGKPGDAERLLHEALAGDPSNADLLTNTIVASKYQQRPSETIDRLRERLTAVGARHCLVQDLDLKASLFDRCAQRFV